MMVAENYAFSEGRYLPAAIVQKSFQDFRSRKRQGFFVGIPSVLDAIDIGLVFVERDDPVDQVMGREYRGMGIEI